MAWTERYCRDDAAGGGDGTTDANSGANGAWTLAEAITNATAGIRVNVRSGTYANTTTNRTINQAGTTTSPIWWRGFNTTPGDCDTDRTLTHPLFTFTSGALTISGANTWFTSIDATFSSRNGAGVNPSGTNVRVGRCRFINSTNNASATAITCSSGVRQEIFDNYFEVHANGTAAATLSSTNLTFLHNFCVGGVTTVNVSNTAVIVIGNIVRDGSSFGIRFITNGAAVNCIGNTVYNTPKGIAMGVAGTAVPTCGIVAGNILSNCSTVGICNDLGTNINAVSRLKNLFHACTANESGFGDSPAFDEITDSDTDIFVDPANNDFTLLSTGSGRSLADLIEGFTNRFTYADLGAVQAPSSENVLNPLTATFGRV